MKTEYIVADKGLTWIWRCGSIKEAIKTIRSRNLWALPMDRRDFGIYKLEKVIKKNKEK